MAMTPAKALKASAALMMQTPANDATWIARYQAATERLKAKESTIQAGARAKEDIRAEDSTQQSELVESSLGTTGLGRFRGDGQEPGSTTRTLETIKGGDAATSTHDAGLADVEETREVMETPRDAGREEELLELWMKWEEPQ
jgi:hypothetical protein